MVDHLQSLFPIQISGTKIWGHPQSSSIFFHGFSLKSTSYWSYPHDELETNLWDPDTNDFFGEVNVLVGVARQRLARSVARSSGKCSTMGLEPPTVSLRSLLAA